MNMEFHNPHPMERPNALYSINNQKTAAGLDALLYGARDELDNLTEFLSLNRVILGDGGFCLLAAKVRFRPDCGVGTLLDANGIFAELLEQRLVQKAIYYMVPLRGLVLCLVAMPQTRQDSKRLMVANQRLWESAEATTAEFREKTGMEVLAAVSPTCFGLDSIPGTYHRTLDLLQFCGFFGKTDGICGSPEIMPKRRIRLSSEFQDQCNNALNLLLAGRREEFFGAVERDLEEIKNMVPCSLQQYQTLAYQYLDLLCYNLVDHHLADGTVLERTDLFWLVHEPVSFRDLIGRVTELLAQLSSPLIGKQKQKSAILVDKMKSYLQLHYADANLTVSAVAAEFQMTQPVFSAYFIKHTGVGPLEYLNKLRVQKVLELLKTTDQTLPQIAQRAGFGSVSTLHRIFKKITGMTPAQVRSGAEL